MPPVTPAPTTRQQSSVAADILTSMLGAAGYSFVNSAVSGDLAFNVDQRLQDDVIAFDPDVVTVLVGTNDVAAHIDETWMRGCLQAQKPTQIPSPAWYPELIERILDRLQNSTDARILLIEIPIATRAELTPLTDHIHLNERAADLLASQIEAALTRHGDLE